MQGVHVPPAPPKWAGVSQLDSSTATPSRPGVFRACLGEPLARGLSWDVFHLAVRVPPGVETAARPHLPAPGIGVPRPLLTWLMCNSFSIFSSFLDFSGFTPFPVTPR